MKKGGTIRAGIGGWTFEPWRGTFYPEGLPHAKELEYASRAPSPRSRSTAPSTAPDARDLRQVGERDARRFRVLASRARATPSTAACWRRRATPSSASSTPALELGDKLGPMLWQFAPTKKFDAADFGAFLELLPAKFDGAPLRHVVEVRHRLVRARRPSSRSCASTASPCLRRARDLSGDPRRHRAISSTRGCRRARTTDEDRLSAEGARRLGQARAHLGGGRRARRPRRRPTPSTRRRPSRATCSSTSSTRARCAPRTRPWR